MFEASESNSPITHSVPRSLQVGVLNWFAKLWEIEKEEYWGCVTTCGTEGNLHGIYVGRENLPDGILYASADSHYSVFKAARMYRMDNIKVSRFLALHGLGPVEATIEAQWNLPSEPEVT